MGYLIGTMLALAVFAVPAHAKPVKPLADFTRNQVALLNGAVNEVAAVSANERDWRFKRFNLRVQAKVAFTIEVVSVELIPEIELVWQKETAL